VQRLGERFTGFAPAVLMLLIGALLLVTAFARAGAIPHQAHDDYGALLRRHGGSMSHSAGYDAVYRQMSAHSRMLQNAYLGVSGLVLLSAGSFGIALRPARANADDGTTLRST